MSQPTQLGLLTSKQVKIALNGWHRNGKAETPFASLYLFRKNLHETAQTPRHVTNQLLLEGLATLRSVDERAATLLERRFLDQQQIDALGNLSSTSQNTIYVNLRKAIIALTKVISDVDVASRLTQRELLEQRLEAPTYNELIGVDQSIKQLVQQLCVPKAPWLLALEGLGGIGKTSLAHQTLRHIIAQGAYDEIAWVSARRSRLTLGGTITTIERPVLTAEQLIELLARQLLPDVALAQRDKPAALLTALRRRLKQTPHLVVIDNLETLVDLEALLPTLQDLANPSKFLLTSRVALYATPNIYHFAVPELGEADALALVRRESAISNLEPLMVLSDAELHPIYATVGGNPLALRLVVGQAHIFTLRSTLEHLQAARGQTAENLYNYIYWHAWQNLDAISQDVLLIMPLVNPAGDDLEAIADVGAMTLDVVRSALNQLVTLNLVDTRGDANARRYSIHGLTRTFLQEQVLQWRM